MVLLDLPACTEEQLHRYLKKLELRVECWTTTSIDGQETSLTEGNRNQDLIASQPVMNLEDPLTLIKEDEDQDEVRLQLVWELFLTLGRSRIRSQDQFLTFLAIASICGDDETDEGDYLQPFQPVEPNILSSVTHLGGIAYPYLPASRLKKVAPVPTKQQTRTRLANEPSKPIRAYTAFVPRLKYTKINTSLPEPATIASLDIDLLPFPEVQGTIESIDISMTNGTVTSLMPDFLPMKCGSKDCVTFLYNLQPLHRPNAHDSVDTNNVVTAPATSSSAIDVLSIQILLKLELASNTIATIITAWTTNIDFSQALNPAFGAPSQTLQRTNRPSSLNFSPYPNSSKDQSIMRADTSAARIASTSLQHQVIPAAIPRQSSASTLSISFIAPDKAARVGVPFSWRVLIVNNSPKQVKLAIVPLPRIQRPTNTNQHFAKRHAPQSSNSILPPTSVIDAQTDIKEKDKKHTRHGGGGSAAKAVVEDHVLYALHHQASSAVAAAVPPETDIVSLTAELRIGPLGVNQCHEAEIKFIAYKTGVFDVDAIRVVDLARENEGGVGAITDIRELPEIVVEELLKEEA